LIRHALAAVLLALFVGTPAPAADAWWHDAWPCRVRIEAAAGEGDVARTTVNLAGRTTPDGRDLRHLRARGPDRLRSGDP
jgi:hypothetical protein